MLVAHPAADCLLVQLRHILLVRETLVEELRVGCPQVEHALHLMDVGRVCATLLAPMLLRCLRLLPVSLSPMLTVLVCQTTLLRRSRIWVEEEPAGCRCRQPAVVLVRKTECVEELA
jgi:hypothetical protein